ncbi:hypothetical protein NDI45_28515 [Leptolyngbya sp. GB1-A1]|uniref:hypothetical protein n=1 Tax=Leptolyngbya sp. GB1-A1 TaxID=2933908 RepID=UPI003299B706
MTEQPIRRLPQCDQCRNNAHSTFLFCAMHPYGVAVELEQCPDYEHDPNGLENDDGWEPEESAFYNGERIASPVERLTKAQQLELLLWHPLLTGLCPQCRHPFFEDGDRVHWNCNQCGWTDDAV